MAIEQWVRLNRLCFHFIEGPSYTFLSKQIEERISSQSYAIVACLNSMKTQMDSKRTVAKSERSDGSVFVSHIEWIEFLHLPPQVQGAVFALVFLETAINWVSAKRMFLGERSDDEEHTIVVKIQK